ncbi:MAG: MAPEG family protein [Pseudomonadota bacterium]
MTLGYWMILVAGILPYFAVGVSKWRPDYDNSAPRAGVERLGARQQRAYWAQLNGFEAFPLFAAAVIIAHLAGAPQTWIDGLALAFVLLRAVYTVLYIYDKPTPRSLVWVAAMACIVGLFVAAV